MSNKTIALILKSPLQSWGIDSKFETRDTFDYPTKSGIVGIICAAAGIDKYSESTNNTLSDISLFSLRSIRLEQLRHDGVVRKVTPFLNDYQTVGGGYSKKNPFHDGLTLRNAKGKLVFDKSGKSSCIVTYRRYIQDACFISLITCSSELCEFISETLKNPKWGIWLGRKSCIPSIPISSFICDTADIAFETALSKLNEGEFKYVSIGECYDSHDFETTELSIADVPKDFKNRKFMGRDIATR